MNFFKLQVIMCLLLLFGCTRVSENNDNSEISVKVEKDELINANIPNNAVKGDFNGDGKQEWMWLLKPKTASDQMECEGKCNCIIKFSDTKIPDLVVEEFCIGGTPSNEGKLDDNESDEISLIPEWFTSNWRYARVYRLKNAKWEEFTKIHLFLGDNEIVDFIRKDKENPNTVIISEYKWTEDMSEIIVEQSNIQFDD